tara:strand:+ start:230 stop:544 length:315 start_codon:yes stop_codon:yes gene_type:complete
MKTLPRLTWLPKGAAVPTGTDTASLNASASGVARAERRDADIDIQDWLGGTRSVAAIEEAIGLGRYGKSLMILSCQALLDEAYRDDDDEEEDELEERWTPRFRR